MKVLFVDDEPAIRDIGSRMLPLLLPNLELIMAASGEEVIELTGTATFDVVVTDIYMPGISGLDVLREVRHRSPYTECIIMTGAPSMDSVVEALRLGARDFVVKPISYPMLAEKIRKIGEYQERVAEEEKARMARTREATRLGRKVHELEQNMRVMEESIGQVAARLAGASLPLSRQELLVLIDEPALTGTAGGTP